jgi:uncharacterized protein YjbI with pentapeptide repeats
MEAKMIGSKIAEARKKINFSQAQLAQRLFISPQAVGKWERGESLPDLLTFNRLAEILGVDLNYFSENFQSVVAKSISVKSSVKQSTELLPKEQKKKRGWDMSRGNWVDADFSGLKNLQEKFSSSNMKGCKFVSSEMSGLLLKSNNVDNCDFSGSDLSRSHIKNCNIQRCLFTGSNMSELLLKRDNVDSCDFSGSNLSNCSIQKSNLAKNLFKNSLLKEAEFFESYFTTCDFSSADFTGAEFKCGGFQNNLMSNALLNHTAFNAMQIIDIIFEGTINDCCFDGCVFKKVTFRNSKLINTFFKNKSLKQIQFIDCKADRLTYEFLKNGKADLNGITLFELI